MIHSTSIKKSSCGLLSPGEKKWSCMFDVVHTSHGASQQTEVQFLRKKETFPVNFSLG